jgi:hypothetical protein
MSAQKGEVTLLLERVASGDSAEDALINKSMWSYTESPQRVCAESAWCATPTDRLVGLTQLPEQFPDRPRQAAHRKSAVTFFQLVSSIAEIGSRKPGFTLVSFAV